MAEQRSGSISLLSKYKIMCGTPPAQQKPTPGGNDHKPNDSDTSSDNGNDDEMEIKVTSPAVTGARALHNHQVNTTKTSSFSRSPPSPNRRPQPVKFTPDTRDNIDSYRVSDDNVSQKPSPGSPTVVLPPKIGESHSYTPPARSFSTAAESVPSSTSLPTHNTPPTPPSGARSPPVAKPSPPSTSPAAAQTAFTRTVMSPPPNPSPPTSQNHSVPSPPVQPPRPPATNLPTNPRKPPVVASTGSSNSGSLQEQLSQPTLPPTPMVSKYAGAVGAVGGAPKKAPETHPAPSQSHPKPAPLPPLPSPPGGVAPNSTFPTANPVSPELSPTNVVRSNKEAARKILQAVETEANQLRGKPPSVVIPDTRGSNQPSPEAPSFNQLYGLNSSGSMDNPAPNVDWSDSESGTPIHAPLKPKFDSKPAPVTVTGAIRPHPVGPVGPPSVPVVGPASTPAPPPAPTPAAAADDENSAQSIFEGSHDELLHNHFVLDALFCHIPIGIILISPFGIMQAFSKGAERMFLYSSWELVGENVSVLMLPHIGQRHDYFLGRARQRIGAQLALMMGSVDIVNLDNIVIEDPGMLNTITNAVNRMQMFAGQKREVLGVDKTGSSFPLEITVTTVFVRNQVLVLGYVADIRDLTNFQCLTVKQELLLRSILDSGSIIRMLGGERLIKDHFESASVMFCEQHNYTQKAVILDNEELVAQYLCEIFSIFDKIVASTQGDVMKIKTIGDVYMAASGVPISIPDHGLLLVEVAMAMMKGIRVYNSYVSADRSVDTLMYNISASSGLFDNTSDRKKKKDPKSFAWRKKVIPVELRIGISTGPLVGGIFSQLKSNYDLFGATVNKAQRLEATCTPMHIHFDGQTHRMLDPSLQALCKSRTGVSLKGFDKQDTYELDATKDLPSRLWEINKPGGSGSG